MAKEKAVVVKQALDEPEVPAEILAQSIVRIDAGMLKLRESGLTERAIVLLLSHSSGVGQGDCRRVLNSLRNLRKDYTNR